MRSRAFEREVRVVIVGGLVVLLFLAGTAVVVLRNTAIWGIGESLSRFAAQTRAVADLLPTSGDPSAFLSPESAAGRLLGEMDARGAALYDRTSGARVADAPFLPDAGLVPDRLPPEDLGGSGPLVRGGTSASPTILLAAPSGTLVLRVAWDGSAIIEARRNARILAVALPLAALVLVALVVPFLRRLLAPIDALAATARGAGDLVPDAPRAPRDEAAGAVETFARTVETLKKRTEELEELRRSEQRRADALAVTAETLVRSHPGGLLVVDAAGVLAEANAPAREFLGLGLDAIGRAASDALSGVPLLEGAAARARGGEPTLSTDFPLGEGLDARLLELTAVPILDAGQSVLGALLFLEDRTTTRRLERELSARRELAALGEMSAGIAHEFRNATGTILGWARLAAKTEDPVARTRQLEAITAESEHVARVTGDFLFFARPERLETGRCDLGALAREIAEEQRTLAPGVSVSATGDFAVARADAALVRRALVNLVKNACEAVAQHPGAGRVVLRGEGATAGSAVLAVEDDGPGVRDADASKLFVPFYSTKESGTGLGLALVAKIAALHGGAVSVERGRSLPGARFVLSLPRAESVDAPALD